MLPRIDCMKLSIVLKRLGGSTRRFFTPAKVGFSCLVVSAGLVVYRHKIKTSACFKDEGSKIFSSKEVSMHNCASSGVWVSHHGAVYDITEFVNSHPGGKVIMMAAGKPLEPFFEVFSFHKSESILDMLEPYRIGELAEDEDNAITGSNSSIEEGNGYQNDPQRDSRLIVCSEKPFNAETPLDLLVQNGHTPNELFFVRNHMPVPLCNPRDYYLDVCFQQDFIRQICNNAQDHHFKAKFDCNHGRQEDELWCQRLTLGDIKERFHERSVDATLQCSGNRRNEMNQAKPVKGLNWKGGAIGNARWTGVSVAEVLVACGAELPANPILAKGHVRFTGLDRNSVTNEYYETSIPLWKALDPDTLLAYNMNGEELPVDHGYPLRLIVPGFTGARNVKWLQRILVTDQESPSRWQQEDYRCFGPYRNLGDTVESVEAPAILHTPVTSVVCKPTAGSCVVPDTSSSTNGGASVVKLEGYAYSGGGTAIARVDVSVDGGTTWLPATLHRDPQFSSQQAPHRAFSWTLWSAEVPVPYDGTEIEVICKAVDHSYNHQPESPAPIWNMRGLLNNSWHRVPISLTHSNQKP